MSRSMFTHFTFAHLLFIMGVFCGSMSFAQAEGVPFSQAEVLLSSDLIVLAKPRSDQGKTFKAEILDVWVDSGYGLKKGDYLRIKDNVTLGCGFIENVTGELDTAVFILSKDANYWRFSKGDFIPSFTLGNAYMYYEGCEYTATPSKWKADIVDLIEAFELDSDGHLIPKNKEFVPSKGMSDLVLHSALRYSPQHTSRISSPLDCVYYELEPDIVEEPAIWVPSDTLVYNVTEVEPTPVLGDSVFFAQLNLLADELLRSDTRLRAYYSVIVEKDGSVMYAKVLRGFNPEADDKILAALRETKWNPGMLRDQPVRTEVRFPISTNTTN